MYFQCWKATEEQLERAKAELSAERRKRYALESKVRRIEELLNDDHDIFDD
jgi:hypothetical protein